MSRPRKPSEQTQRVLMALAADQTKWRYGYDLAVEVGLKSGSLYPILMRLAERGLLQSDWEQGPPGKPPRHLYRLTADGLEQATALRANRASARSPLRGQLGQAR
ncbi:MAG: PadR family transcriptional regulator [Actinomycetota bacterium]|nr:PadR family transcriptional regulator [Actinomycetota bacterium]MDQ2955614.1 PadR family transcriptional regulator [Actinomycetota bacterium]